jgi:hypothetical protein
MFEDGSSFSEIMAVLVVSAVAFILIIVFYGWR